MHIFMRTSLLFFLYAVCVVFVSGCEKQVRLSNGRIIYQPINGSYTPSTQQVIVQQPIIQQQEQKPMMQPVSNPNTAFGQEGVVSVKELNNQYTPNTSNVNTNAFVSASKDTNSVPLPSSGKTQDNIDYNGSLLQQAIMASRNQASINNDKDNDEFNNRKPIVQQENNDKPLPEKKPANNIDSPLKKGLYLQLGAFNDKDGALFIQKKALSVGIKSQIVFMEKQHHILVGPYKTRAEGAKNIDILDSIDMPFFWKEV